MRYGRDRMRATSVEFFSPPERGVGSQGFRIWKIYRVYTLEDHVRHKHVHPTLQNALFGSSNSPISDCFIFRIESILHTRVAKCPFVDPVSVDRIRVFESEFLVGLTSLRYRRYR
jgi:hypothetical protein